MKAPAARKRAADRNELYQTPVADGCQVMPELYGNDFVLALRSRNHPPFARIRWETVMGLFDFVKDVGKKVFGNEAEASDKIKEEIEKDNPGVKDLQVGYDNGVVSLSGNADSPEAMEKAVLMAGNIEGVGEVKADALNAPPQTEAVAYHVIEKGDTLWALAKRFYGDGNAYPRIFEANREVIKDPDLIFVGQKIRIPKGEG